MESETPALLSIGINSGGISSSNAGVHKALGAIGFAREKETLW